MIVLSRSKVFLFQPTILHCTPRMISLQCNNDCVPILRVLGQKYDIIQTNTPEHTTSSWCPLVLENLEMSGKNPTGKVREKSGENGVNLEN